jgi:hypothetical protein
MLYMNDKMSNRLVSPESATEWLLKLIVWEFFCTFTWSSLARSCTRKRRTHVTRWLRYWARTVRPGVADPLGQLAFVIRWERGEIGGLPHCHVLISRFPERSINPSTCFAIKNTWKHGIAQVRLYDPYVPGDVSRYLSKGRFLSAADCEGANTYEMRKFNRADWIYISPGASGGNVRSSNRHQHPVILYDIYCLMLLIAAGACLQT